MYDPIVTKRATVLFMLVFSFILATIPAFAGSAEEELFDASKAGSVEKVNALIDQGADINAKGDHGLTPLYYAALFGQRQVCQILLSKGAAVSPKDIEGLTPLHGATMKGHRDIVQLLLSKGADINATDVVNGASPLFYGALEGRTDASEVLLAKGADPNTKNKDGVPALFLAARDGRASIVQLLLGGVTGTFLSN